MPAKLKEVRNRIKSVISTQQITKAMKMVSAAKLRRATDRIIQMRPYSNKLSDILNNIVAGSDGGSSIVYAKQREVKNVLLIVITSDRGLCGGFNSNILKLARLTIEQKYSAQKQAGKLKILTIGKKSYEYFKRNNYDIISDYYEMFLNLTFEESAKASESVMNGWTEGKFDAVEIIYSKFKNAATQVFTAEQFLPIGKIENRGEKIEDRKTKNKPDFIFEPNQELIIEELVPKILKTQFFRALLDSNASEHGARMTAMDKATENANELLKELRLTYNRARQAAITTELTEIVSGANALEGG